MAMTFTSIWYYVYSNYGHDFIMDEKDSVERGFYVMRPKGESPVERISDSGDVVSIMFKDGRNEQLKAKEDAILGDGSEVAFRFMYRLRDFLYNTAATTAVDCVAEGTRRFLNKYVMAVTNFDDPYHLYYKSIFARLVRTPMPINIVCGQSKIAELVYEKLEDNLKIYGFWCVFKAIDIFLSKYYNEIDAWI